MFKFHLAVMQWRPNSRKQIFNLQKMFIWAQFVDLPMEYFNSNALFKMAKTIDRPIKMDIQTSEATRGRFARVCIEVDVKKPLPPFIKINQLKQEGAYEINTSFCNKCGIIGHLPVQCIAGPQNLEEPNIKERDSKGKEQDWKIIEKKRTIKYR